MLGGLRQFHSGELPFLVPLKWRVWLGKYGNSDESCIYQDFMLFPLHPCHTRPSASSTRSVPVPSMLASSRRTPAVNGPGRCWNSVFLELQRLRLSLPLLVSLTGQNHNQRQIYINSLVQYHPCRGNDCLTCNWFHNILRHFHFENLQLSSSKNHREHILLHAQWKAALRALGFEVKKEDVQETQRFLGDLRLKGHGPKRYGLHSGTMKLVDGQFLS